MKRSRKDIEISLEKVLDRLREVAIADRIITFDEEQLLDRIGEDFTNLKKQLFQILESDLEDVEFRIIVHDLLLDIIDDALSVANEDGVVTDDEHDLILVLQKYVREGAGEL